MTKNILEHPSILLQICEECNSSDFVYDADIAEKVCAKCGLVQHRKTSDKERNLEEHSLEEVCKFIGPQISSNKEQYCTSFVLSKDCRGKNLSTEQKVRMIRFRKLSQISTYGKGSARNMTIARFYLRNFIEKQYSRRNSKLYDSTLDIYKKCLDLDLIRGTSIEAYVVASFYAACRKLNIGKTLLEISKLANRDEKEISRCYRKLVQNLKLGSMPIDDPEKFIEKYAQRLNLPREIEIRSIEVLKDFRSRKLNQGKMPSVLAIAALYIVSKDFGLCITKKDFADVAGTNKVTLSNRLVDFENIGYCVHRRKRNLR